LRCPVAKASAVGEARGAGGPRRLGTYTPEAAAAVAVAVAAAAAAAARREVRAAARSHKRRHSDHCQPRTCKSPAEAAGRVRRRISGTRQWSEVWVVVSNSNKTVGEQILKCVTHSGHIHFHDGGQLVSKQGGQQGQQGSASKLTGLPPRILQHYRPCSHGGTRLAATGEHGPWGAQKGALPECSSKNRGVGRSRFSLFMCIMGMLAQRIAPTSSGGGRCRA